MLAVKRFNGVLDKDSREADVLPPNHIQARNVRFIPNSNGGSFNPIKGNTYVSNSNLPAGTNECIGAFFDQVKQRIIWFNWNQYGNNGIYQYTIQTGLVSKIFLCNTDSATDILNFSLDYPVHSAAIVYRTTGDGDMLYWTDGYNRPRCINLDTVSALAPFTEDMINAAKNAPLTPPTLDYEDDATKTVNNLKKKLFRACYRWVYKNGEKSTFSPISKVPLPTSGYDPTTDNDPTKNNNIEIQVTAGGEDYQAIEIAGQFNVNDTWGDFFLIDKLDRDEYSILPDTTYDYYFYNDGVYSTIDPEQTDLYFSWLPDKANTLELLNGNVLIYGGLTDGYDPILREDVDVTVSVAAGNPNVPTISFAYSGTNVITILIGSVIQNFAVYSVSFDYVSGSPGDASPKNVQYTTSPGNTQANIVSGLISLLSGANISADSLGGGVIRVYTTGFIGGSSITNVVVGVSTAGSEVAAATWKWNCAGRLGLVYFNDRGKTNGVVSFVSDDALDNTDFAFNTPSFDTNFNIPQVPIVSGTINHTPPTWAVAYQWVRAALTPKFLYWTTNDYQSDTDYLYFCIQNLVYTGTKTSGFVPSYEFAEGDRVRVLAAYSGGNFAAYNTQLDMEILGVEQRTMAAPNSSTNGLFVKVAKPNSIPAYQQTMLIELYTPKPTTNEGSQLFYEWGEKYNIIESNDRKLITYTPTSGLFIVGETITQTGGGGGVGVINTVSLTQLEVTVVSGSFGGGYFINGGTSLAAGVVTNVSDLSASRYHQGGVSNQTAFQPAVFQWYDGDVYYRPRKYYTSPNTAVTTASEYFVDANYSDYFESEVNSNGRGWVIDENAKEEYNQVLVRWGGKYQSGTNINQLNIFRPSDFDEVDRSKGDIRRFKVRDRILRVFQDRGVGQYGIYARFIQNNEGESDLVTTNEIITTNNIQYYQGIFGLCGYPTNLCSSPIADYFTDVVTGRGIRLGNDGITDLGLLYKGQFYFPQLVTPYNKELTRTNGSASKVMAFYDTFDNDFHTILQAGTGGGTTAAGSHFAFNELRNGYICDEYSYIPEWALSANDVIYSWENGNLWRHDNNDTKFYGVQYAADVTFVFNDNLTEKKSWNSISELSDSVWVCPLIYTNVNTYGTQRQETNLVEAEFTVLEGMPSAVIKRDSNSPGGKLNGNFMKGNWMAAKFRKENAKNNVFLNQIDCRFTDSPRTDK